MEILLIILIIGGSLLAILTAIPAILESWEYAILTGSSRGFIPNVFNQMSGNLIAVLGIVVLCLPTWLILYLTIAKKLKKPWYNKMTNLLSDENYVKAIEIFSREMKEHGDSDDAKSKSIDFLKEKGASEDDANTNLEFLSSIGLLSINSK